MTGVLAETQLEWPSIIRRFLVRKQTKLNVSHCPVKCTIGVRCDPEMGEERLELNSLLSITVFVAYGKMRLRW